jgi:hypothetical protein
MNSNDVALVYGKIDEAALEVHPDSNAANSSATMFLMNREQLADYARRVFKVAVEKAL